MDIIFLEILYYIMSIVASLGIIYNFLKNIVVSIGYEFVFLNAFQRVICKLYYFIKNLISSIIGIGFIVFAGGGSVKCIMLLDFIMYILILYFYNFPDFFYQKVSKFVAHRRKTTILCKVCISIIATFLSYVFLSIFKYKFVIFQVIVFITFYSKYITKYSAPKLKKVFNNDFVSPFIMFVLLFSSVKLLVFYTKNAFKVAFYEFVINATELNIEIVQKLWGIFKNEELSVIGILILSISLACYGTYNQFNFKAILWHENKSWEILHITMDNHALCSLNNLKMMIKTDTIKTDYYCLAINGTYQFFEKSKNFFHNLD